MTAAQLLEELRPLGKESYKRVMCRNHGVPEPCFGVPISALKPIQKRIRKDYQLALDLYATSNYDARYLAGLIADDARMTRSDLQNWVEHAVGGCLVGTTVPSVAVGSPVGLDLAREWLESPEPRIAAAGWATFAMAVSVRPDAQLDLVELRGMLGRVERTLPHSPDLVRYHQNSFVICVGCYVVALTEAALEVGRRLGPVTADLGANACQVPGIEEYIGKVAARGALGKKRKSAKC
jgi:hypothetical protein